MEPRISMRDEKRARVESRQTVGLSVVVYWYHLVEKKMMIDCCVVDVLVGDWGPSLSAKNRQAFLYVIPTWTDNIV